MLNADWTNRPHYQQEAPGKRSKGQKVRSSTSSPGKLRDRSLLGKTSKYPKKDKKDDKSLLVSLQNLAFFFSMQKYAEV